MNPAVMIGAALVAVGAVAAFAIKTQPADRAPRGRRPGPVRHGLRLRLVLVRAAGDTPDTEDHDVGAVKVPVLAGAS